MFSIPFVALFVAYFAFMPAAIVILVAGESSAGATGFSMRWPVRRGRRRGRSSWQGLLLPAGNQHLRPIRTPGRHHGGDRRRHGRRHLLLAQRRALGRKLAARRPIAAYFAWAVRILSAKAENTPAKQIVDHPRDARARLHRRREFLRRKHHRRRHRDRQHDEHGAEEEQLSRRVRIMRGDELRQEGHEEQDDLRVEQVDREARADALRQSDI